MKILQRIGNWTRGPGAGRGLVKSRTKLVLGVERLDERLVPAGNVTGVVENGHLILTGDGEDNSIEIRKGINAIRIAGLAGTNVNGAPGIEDFVGVFKDVIINLKAGDDVVNLEGGGGGTAAVIARDLVFTGGNGSDTLTSVPGAMVGRDLVFTGGAAVSHVTLDDLQVGRDAKFSGNDDLHFTSTNGITIHGLLKIQSLGEATVALDGDMLGRLSLIAEERAEVEINDVLVGGKARIKGGSGNDVIDVDLGSEVLGNLLIETQGGNDVLDLDVNVGGDAVVNLGTGTTHDLDVTDMVVFGKLQIISAGTAADHWELDGVEVYGKLALTAGDGANTVVFNDCEFNGATTYLGGAGVDHVEISDGSGVYFRGTTLIDLGAGADMLQLGLGAGEADFDYQVTLQGGDGADVLNDVNSDFNQSPVVAGF